MSKSFSTLVSDLYNVVESSSGGTASLDDFKHNIAHNYVRQVAREDREREPNTLYFSELGKPCNRKLWYQVNNPAAGESLRGTTRIKFVYGDVLEEIVLQLARDAGHSVERTQEKVRYGVGSTGWYINGRLDAVVDGVVVDVKSVTGRSIKKFENGLVDDPFGYYHQLNGYASVLKNEDAAFITIEKELGNIKAFSITPNEQAFVDRAHDAVTIVTNPIPEQRLEVKKLDNGNEQLSTTCSYCQFKKDCWKGLRTFMYSTGPVYLTKVVALPRVLEIENGQK